ncbi:ATP-binding cassette domain-containing protein [bacterium]|nr:ATP-binding cassette domain-containing protein [bacterium]
MKKDLLRIENLKVQANGKEILKRINLQIKKREVQALLGPNGSGKTVLGQIILGNPKYKVTQGKIFFEGKEITKLAPEKRVKLGMTLAFQSAPAIKGVKLIQLLEKISQFSAKELVKGKIPDGRNLLERDVNLDFSGGEKKISELVQVLALNPKLVIFDEIDSGLDLKRLEKVAKIIKKEFIDKKTSVLLITHSGAILNFLNPKITNVMVLGKIICREKDYKKVLRVIKKYGYEKCKKCKLLTN